MLTVARMLMLATEADSIDSYYYYGHASKSLYKRIKANIIGRG